MILICGAWMNSPMSSGFLRWGKGGIAEFDIFFFIRRLKLVKVLVGLKPAVACT